MEMETSAMPPKAPRLTVEEDALASQVLEIIGGISLEALQTLQEPEDREVWSLEEGDDSVFYSDEDQARQDVQARASPDFGASECEHLVDNVTADEAIAQGREESIQENPEMEKEETQHVVLTEQGEEHRELETPKSEPVDQSDPGDPKAPSSPEESVSICGESVQPSCTIAEMQAQAEQNISAEKVNPQIEEEDAALEAQTPNLETFDVSNEQSYKRLAGEEKLPEQMSRAEMQISSDSQTQADRDPDRDHSLHPGYSTLPLPNKSGHQRSFNHLVSTKYSTVSYRKIRRGNTRQKIEEFEYMIMNL